MSLLYGREEKMRLKGKHRAAFLNSAGNVEHRKEGGRGTEEKSRSYPRFEAKNNDPNSMRRVKFPTGGQKRKVSHGQDCRHMDGRC